MTARDLRWRGAGALLFGSACASPLLGQEAAARVIIHFCAAIAGLVLMLSGKRMAVLFRAERRGHCATAAVVHAARMRRRK